MTRDESLEVVGMILTFWQVKNWTKDEIDAYAKNIQHLDAEVATSTLIRASRDVAYPPKVAELHERYREEMRRLRPVVAPKDDPVGQPIPEWVKRWICARMLYKSFGKAKDYRRFPEQGDWGDLTKELMPEGAWVEEAAAFDDEEIMRRWRQAISSGVVRE